jgi:cobyrinic acid a,c-diamide synthase
MIPALVIAGTGSGVGKTSITLGLCRALTRRGVRVQPVKVGPDYLDPTHLTQAAGRLCWNLDPWMMGEAYVRELAASADADLLLIEGVMGLYDGADAGRDDGSTAQVARLLDAPVWLVAEAAGAARSFAATVRGFTTFPDAPRITGILANRCGSDRHVAVLREALASVGLPPLIGAIPKDALPTLASRHLGLKAASDTTPLDTLTDAVERFVTLPDCTQKKKQDGEDGEDAGQPAHIGAALNPSYPPHPVPTRSRFRLAVAWDAAFSFAYADLWPALAQRGVAIVRFSPLSDAAVPEADGLYLPGGYPELHAATLAANSRMLASIRAFCASGRTVYAECGGLMYLSQGILCTDGQRHALTGVLPVGTRMLPRRKALGYVELTLTTATCIGSAGDLVRGHEFHYSELEADPAGWQSTYAVAYRRGERAREGWQRGNILATYVHLHLASRPAALDAFVNHLRARSPC